MNYIIYDLEATCWEGSPPGIIQETIEIGAFRINEYAEVTGEYNRFVKPIINPFLSPFCKKLTTIQQEDVNRASKFDRVIEEFQDWIGLIDDDDYMLCSWGSFDKKLLIADCLLHRLEPDWVEHHVNLKKEYQRIQKLSKPCGLKKAIRLEGLEFVGTQHRGIDDAENLAQVFIKHFGEWNIMT